MHERLLCLTPPKPVPTDTVPSAESRLKRLYELTVGVATAAIAAGVANEPAIPSTELASNRVRARRRPSRK